LDPSPDLSGLSNPAREHHELIGITDNDAVGEIDANCGYLRFDASSRRIPAALQLITPRLNIESRPSGAVRTSQTP
jgi:hypothetical protein